MLTLRDYQQQASSQIADRFRRYYADPPIRGTAKSLRHVPFFQALASITASGKTVILADAVESITSSLPISPVVLWLSKGKVVVEQTLANLSPRGKYNHLLGEVDVETLADYDAQRVRDTSRSSLFFATVGTFNQRDKENGDRLIYKAEIDTADESVWNALKSRLDSEDRRRPLIIIYDEAQNLSDQQTDLLLELEPDALIVASATMVIRERLASEIRELRSAGWKDDELVTSIDSSAVADSGLIKSTVLLAGYEAPMEETISSMLDDFHETEDLAAQHGVKAPKAIYVCKTNIVEGDAFRRDDPRQAFSERQAPPIVIWRYLVDHCDVDPESIAVYCSLRFDKSYPAPEDFHLFSGGDRDYENFISGDYRHVIFNLGLQEGWDDPQAYFAYIDKSMESNVAVEQVIGRLLRQPDGRHFAADRLNTAHFYIRVDKRGVFGEVLNRVADKLHTDAPEVRLIQAPPGKSRPESIDPVETCTVYETGYDTSLAVGVIRSVLASLSDYRDDSHNTKSSGGRATIQRRVGKSDGPEWEWEDFEHTNQVSARWVFQREVLKRFPGALGVSETADAKFDALVGFGSPAYASVTRAADDVVEGYVDNVVLKQRRLDPYVVGPTLVRPDVMHRFSNAVHSGYSDLNDTLELPFAIELDTTGHRWCRNPSRSGYSIPLITLGPTRNFYPDFLVWVNDDVFALDTTGTHLLREKTARKLLSITPPKNSSGRLIIRFISRGQFNREHEQVAQDGYTVWGLRQDMTLRSLYADDVSGAVKLALSASL